MREKETIQKKKCWSLSRKLANVKIIRRNITKQFWVSSESCAKSTTECRTEDGGCISENDGYLEKTENSQKSPYERGIFYGLFDDFVDNSVVFCFFCGHPVVAIHVFFYLVEGFAGVFCKNLGEAFF